MLNDKSEREPVLTSLGFCLRVVVNEKTLNLEKTTSIVLSVLMIIYDWTIYFLVIDTVHTISDWIVSLL